MLEFEMYEGKNSTIKIDDIVLNFLKEYKNNNHIIYMDSNFSNPTLFKKLYDFGIDALGMIKQYWRGLFRDLANLKLDDYESESFEKDNLMILQWRDKRIMNILSLIKTYEINEVKYFNKEEGIIKTKIKPSIIIDYADSMKGVDRNNQMLSYFSYPYKVTRWWFIKN